MCSTLAEVIDSLVGVDMHEVWRQIVLADHFHDVVLSREFWCTEVRPRSSTSTGSMRAIFDGECKAEIKLARLLYFRAQHLSKPSRAHS